MENTVLARLQTLVGKPFSSSPSKFGRWFNGTLLEVERGRMHFSFEVREDMTNPLGTLHGGATAGIIDDIIGLTAATFGQDNFYVTVNLSIDFLSGAKVGDIIYAFSQVIREGRNISNIECIVKHADGKIIAKGTSNMMKTDIKRSNA